MKYVMALVLCSGLITSILLTDATIVVIRNNRLPLHRLSRANMNLLLRKQHADMANALKRQQGLIAAFAPIRTSKHTQSAREWRRQSLERNRKNILVNRQRLVELQLKAKQERNIKNEINNRKIMQRLLRFHSAEVNNLRKELANILQQQRILETTREVEKERLDTLEQAKKIAEQNAVMEKFKPGTHGSSDLKVNNTTEINNISEIQRAQNLAKTNTAEGNSKTDKQANHNPNINDINDKNNKSELQILLDLQTAEVDSLRTELERMEAQQQQLEDKRALQKTRIATLEKAQKKTQHNSVNGQFNTDKQDKKTANVNGINLGKGVPAHMRAKWEALNKHEHTKMAVLEKAIGAMTNSNIKRQFDNGVINNSESNQNIDLGEPLSPSTINAVERLDPNINIKAPITPSTSDAIGSIHNIDGSQSQLSNTVDADRSDSKSDWIDPITTTTVEIAVSNPMSDLVEAHSPAIIDSVRFNTTSIFREFFPPSFVHPNSIMPELISSTSINVTESNPKTDLIEPLLSTIVDAAELNQNFDLGEPLSPATVDGIESNQTFDWGEHIPPTTVDGIESNQTFDWGEHIPPTTVDGIESNQTFNLGEHIPPTNVDGIESNQTFDLGENIQPTTVDGIESNQTFDWGEHIPPTTIDGIESNQTFDWGEPISPTTVDTTGFDPNFDRGKLSSPNNNKAILNQNIDKNEPVLPDIVDSVMSKTVSDLSKPLPSTSVDVGNNTGDVSIDFGEPVTAENTDKVIVGTTPNIQTVKSQELTGFKANEDLETMPSGNIAPHVDKESTKAESTGFELANGEIMSFPKQSFNNYTTNTNTDIIPDSVFLDNIIFRRLRQRRQNL